MAAVGLHSLIGVVASFLSYRFILLPIHNLPLTLFGLPALMCNLNILCDVAIDAKNREDPGADEAAMSFDNLFILGINPFYNRLSPAASINGRGLISVTWGRYLCWSSCARFQYQIAGKSTPQLGGNQPLLTIYPWAKDCPGVNEYFAGKRLGVVITPLPRSHLHSGCKRPGCITQRQNLP